MRCSARALHALQSLAEMLYVSREASSAMCTYRAIRQVMRGPFCRRWFTVGALHSMHTWENCTYAAIRAYRLPSWMKFKGSSGLWPIYACSREASRCVAGRINGCTSIDNNS